LVGLQRGDRIAPADLDRLELGAELVGHRLAHEDPDAGAPLAGLGILGEPRRRLGNADAEGAALLGRLERALGARRERQDQARAGDAGQCRTSRDGHDLSPLLDLPDESGSRVLRNRSVVSTPRRMWSAISARTASRSSPSTAAM